MSTIPMPDKTWTLLGSQYVKEYKVIRMREDRYRFEPTQSEADYAICESRDWTIVLPVTDHGDVVLIRQYRHGVQQTVLEFPGGLLDANESPEQAAARELEEETGYVANRVRYLGPLLPNPALNTAVCHACIAEGCEPIGKKNPDPFEQIEVLTRRLADTSEMIRSGELCHAQMIATLSLYNACRGGG